MSKGIHKVVLYVHKKLKRFSITARTPNARLAEVDSQMAKLGFKRIVLAEYREKPQAEELRDIARSSCKFIGYTYQTRRQLS